MRFLAVYSTSPFQVDCTISEESSRNSEKNQKIFSVMSYFRQFKPLKNAVAMHFLTPCTGSFKLSSATLFFIFLSKQKVNTHFFSGSIVIVMGNSIKCEGERQKHPRYIIVSRMFRFLSPTKLNRDEQAVYSAAHTIQPLCLAGVRNLFFTSALRL